MLTGRLVRVRHARGLVIPVYVDCADPELLALAEQLLQIYRSHVGRTRGELEQECKEALGDQAGHLVHQGLAKLVEDRCDFEVVAGKPPELVRECVFRLAAQARRQPTASVLTAAAEHRASVLEQAARELEMTPAAVEQGLFADLRSEQLLVNFKDTTAQRLLERYNVALAQAVLLRSTRVHLTVRSEPPARRRQLFRMMKFHRLACEVEAAEDETLRFHLDGPLSLFSATQKYGLQLALFLPALLRCRDFELLADLQWGPGRKARQFRLTPADGLVSHQVDAGSYVPPEIGMFADLFRKKIADWELRNDATVVPLGREGFWVPDFVLVQRASGRQLRLEILGFWRRSSLEQHLRRLRNHLQEPFLLAVADGLKVDADELAGLPAGVHRFRQMPLPEEIVRLAEELLDPVAP